MLNAEGNNYRIMNSKRYIEINEENEDEKEIEELKERITQLEYRTIELKGIIEGKTKHSLLDRFIDIFR